MKQERLPKISVVTPSFNQGRFLEQTITSLLNQDYPNVEYIIIDGGSTDNSADIIRKYADRLAYWESVPDRGPAHALNKGFARATGQIFGWLNSDDYLLPGALHTVARVFWETDVDFVFGDSLHADGNGMITDCSVLPAMNPFAYMLYALGCLHQESCFWKASLHRAVGQLDETLFPGFDIDWFLRLTHIVGSRYYYIRVPLGVAREHPEQNIALLRELGENEGKQMVLRPRADFIRKNSIPRWKLFLGGIFYGSRRRVHETYLRRLGPRHLFHFPQWDTLRRMVNLKRK